MVISLSYFLLHLCILLNSCVSLVSPPQEGMCDNPSVGATKTTFVNIYLWTWFEKPMKALVLYL